MPQACPSWLGYFLLFPLRRVLENPEKMLKGIVRHGMTVLEPGCGMGYFTIPMAEMVGNKGKVIAVDIQAKMLSVLERRARKAGLSDRIEIRLATEEGLGLGDLEEKIDLVPAIHMVHEVRDRSSFFREIRNVLRPDGRVLVLEPAFHVSRAQLEETILLAEKIGLRPAAPTGKIPRRGVLLAKG